MLRIIYNQFRILVKDILHPAVSIPRSTSLFSFLIQGKNTSVRPGHEKETRWEEPVVAQSLRVRNEGSSKTSGRGRRGMSVGYDAFAAWVRNRVRMSPRGHPLRGRVVFTAAVMPTAASPVPSRKTARQRRGARRRKRRSGGDNCLRSFCSRPGATTLPRLRHNCASCSLTQDSPDSLRAGTAGAG